MPVTRHMVRQPWSAITADDISDLDSGLTDYWDASNAGSITESGGSVSQWNSLGPGANHFTQSTGASQPITPNDPTGRGLNYIRVESGHSMASNATASDISQTTYSVIYSFGFTSGALLCYSIGGAGLSLYFDSSTVGAYLMVKSGVAGIGSLAPVSSGSFLSVAASDASNWAMSHNNLGESTGTHSQTLDGGTTLQLGPGPAGHLYVGELRRYNVMHDITQRQRVRAWLRNKWGSP